MLHYTPNIRKSPHTLKDVLQRAKQWFEGLPKTEQVLLKGDLRHDAGCLTTKRQLNVFPTSVFTARKTPCDII